MSSDFEPDFQLETQTVKPVVRKLRSPWRERARAVIARVLAAHIGSPRKVIRRALRAAYPDYAPIRRGYLYKAWCDEVAFALRERSRRPGSRAPFRPLATADVIPSARGWMAERGLLEVTAVLDVDLMDAAAPAESETPSYQLVP